MITLFFIELESSTYNSPTVIDYKNAFNWRFDSIDGLFDVFGHLNKRKLYY